MVARISVAVLLIAYGANCEAENVSRREATATRTTQRPLIDGQLVDDCWQKSKWYTGFTRLNSTEPAAQQTSFAVLFNDDNIYLGIRCNEPAVGELKKNVKDRDGQVWEDDCVEIMLLPAKELNPDPNYIEHHHLIVNTLGTQFDRVIKAGTGLPWDGEWKSATNTGRNYWSAEVVIPFSSLNITRETGTDWLFNVCRTRRVANEGSSSWSPTGPSFSTPSEFARLKGLDVKFEKFVYAVNTLKVRPADGAFSVQMNVANGGAFTGMLRAELAFMSSQGQMHFSNADFETHAGKNRNVTVGPFAFPNSDNYRLYATLKDPKGRVVKRALRNVNIVVSPLQVRITQPVYRENIYYTQNIREIVVSVSLNMPRADRALHSLEAVLLQTSNDQYASAVTASSSLSQKTILKVDARGLPIGNYVVVVTLKKGDQQIASVRKNIRKLGKAPGCEVRIDKNLNLLVDGKQYIPSGFLATGAKDDFGPIVESGFNTVHDYTLHYDDTAEVMAHLDHLHARGLKILVAPFHKIRHDFNGFGNRNALKQTLTDKEIARMLRFVKEVSTHPALLGWYICDEPRGVAHLRTLENTCQELRRLDPHHPVIALDNSSIGCLGLSKAADVLLLNKFPDFLQGSGSVAPLSAIAGGTEVIYQSLDVNLPVWGCPQAFDRSLLRIGSNYRAPTYLEARCMTYLALVRNAKGILYYEYGQPDWKSAGRPGRSGIFASPSLEIGMLEGIGPELRAMKPALALPVSSRSVTASNNNVLILLKEADKHLYLITVNPSPKSTTCEFRIDGLGSRMLHVVAEGRTVTSKGKGIVTDEFGPNAVHIYTTDPTLTKLRTVKDVLRLISQAQAKPNTRWKQPGKPQ